MHGRTRFRTRGRGFGTGSGSGGALSLTSVLAQLIGAGESVAYYDPQDLTSLYQSRTGGRVFSANGQAVGIMLDKSQMGSATAAAYLAILPTSELIANGTFTDDATGATPATWTTNNANASLVKQANGTALFTSTSFAYALTQAGSKIPVTAGKLYRISFVISNWVAGLLAVHVGLTNGGNVIDGNGSYSYIYAATTTTTVDFQIRPNGGGTGSFEIDNISVKEIPGYHAVAPSDAARPILSVSDDPNLYDVTGQPELVTNGTFNADSDWTKGADWTIGSGIATHAGGTSSGITQSITTKATTSYKLAITISGHNGSGLLTVQLYGGGGSENFTLFGNGTYERVITTTIARNLFGVFTSSGWDGSIDDVSVKEIPENQLTYYLEANGTDDWMNVSPTLDLGDTWAHVGGWRSDATGDAPFATSDQEQSALSASGKWTWYDTSSTQVDLVSGTITDPHVLTIEQASASALTGRINQSAGSAIDPYDGSTPTKGLALFSRENDAAAALFDGVFYGGLWSTGSLTAQQRLTLERAIAMKMRITI